MSTIPSLPILLLILISLRSRFTSGISRLTGSVTRMPVSRNSSMIHRSQNPISWLMSTGPSNRWIWLSLNVSKILVDALKI